MKLNILDPGLNFKAGHHFDYNRKLVKSLADDGHDVHVYGFAEMHDETVAEFKPYAKVTKLFRAMHYARPERTDVYAGDLVLYDRHLASFVKDLASVRQADRWLWPSFRPAHLAACAELGTKAEVVGCIHEDPGIQAQTGAAMLWRMAFVKALQSGLRYQVGTIEAEIRHRFMPIVPDGRFSLFPHPYDGPVLDKPKTALKRIGFFGHQRGEKGTRQILELLNQLIADDYRVVFHDSNADNGPLRHPKIETLRYVEDIMEPIAGCDLVVLTYDVPRYNMKGSGILAACLAVGVPVTAPFGTIPGRVIEEMQAGPLFPALTAQAVYSTIKFAEQNYAAYASNAFRAARQFASRNGTARYAAQFLAPL